MTNKFEGLSANEIAQAIIDLDTSSQIGDAFNELGKMDASVSKNVANVLEKQLLAQADTLLNTLKEPFPDMSVSEIAKIAKTMKKRMTDAYDGQPLQDSDDGFEQWIKDMVTPPTAEEVEQSAAQARALCTVFNKIAEIKGETAAPATKAIVKEIATLTDDDKKDGEQITMTMLKGYEKATKKGPKI